MKKTLRLAGPKPTHVTPAPFLVVFARSKDSSEWSVSDETRYANIAPAMTLREAEKIVLAVIQRDAIVARIFEYQPGEGGLYVLTDEKVF